MPVDVLRQDNAPHSESFASNGKAARRSKTNRHHLQSGLVDSPKSPPLAVGPVVSAASVASATPLLAASLSTPPVASPSSNLVKVVANGSVDLSQGSIKRHQQQQQQQLAVVAAAAAAAEMSRISHQKELLRRSASPSSVSNSGSASPERSELNGNGNGVSASANLRSPKEVYTNLLLQLRHAQATRGGSPDPTIAVTTATSCTSSTSGTSGTSGTTTTATQGSTKLTAAARKEKLRLQPCFQCPVCKKRFQRHIAMNSHFQNEHIGQPADGSDAKICRLCSQTSKDIFDMRLHLATSHKIDLESPKACLVDAEATTSNSNSGYYQHQHQQVRQSQPHHPKFSVLRETLNTSPQKDLLDFDHRSSAMSSPSSNPDITSSSLSPERIRGSPSPPPPILIRVENNNNYIKQEPDEDQDQARDLSVKKVPSKASSPAPTPILAPTPISAPTTATAPPTSSSSKRSSSASPTPPSVSSGAGAGAGTGAGSRPSKRRKYERKNNNGNSNSNACVSNHGDVGVGKVSGNRWNGSLSSAGSPNPPWQCHHCLISFPNQTLYFLHRGFHSELNPWQCNGCGHLCSDMYDFNTHLMSDPHH